MKTTRLLSYSSPREHYKADAAILWCFDDRFSKLLEHFIWHLGLSHKDVVQVAGGAKDLAEDGIGRQYLFKQISGSLSLHHPKLVWLMFHDECGAYDGKTGVDFYRTEAGKAFLAVRQHLDSNGMKDVKIRVAFADFDGLDELGDF
jgi:hypothetical protein